MVITLDKNGNPTITPDTEQLNITMDDKYPKGTYIFTSGKIYSEIKAIVDKVSKSLELVYEPLPGCFVLLQGAAKATSYKKAKTVLKKEISDLQVL